MRFTRHPSKTTLRRAASSAGIEITFIEKRLMMLPGGSRRRGKVVRLLTPLGLRSIASWLLSMMGPRVMLWTK